MTYQQNDLQSLVNSMSKEKTISVKKVISFSWGNYLECRSLFEHLFLSIDQTISKFTWLPEYDEIIDWMTNTDGKGLFLMGDCGLGKSIVATGVVPVLLRLKSRACQVVHAQDLGGTTRASTERGVPQTYLDLLLRTGTPIIDELGVESMISEWGEKFEGFNRVINNAEKYNYPVFCTTNLSADEILGRYGVRTLDRICKLSKIIEFKGNSLR